MRDGYLDISEGFPGITNEGGSMARAKQ